MNDCAGSIHQERGGGHQGTRHVGGLYEDPCIVPRLLQMLDVDALGVDIRIQTDII